MVCWRSFRLIGRGSDPTLADDPKPPSPSAIGASPAEREAAEVGLGRASPTTDMFGPRIGSLVSRASHR